MKRWIAIIAVSIVAACATPKTPEHVVFAATQTYAGALLAAVAYKRLPPCPSVSKICADPVIVARLQSADDLAFALLEGAQHAVRNNEGDAAKAVEAAELAVKTFSAVTKLIGGTK